MAYSPGMQEWRTKLRKKEFPQKGTRKYGMRVKQEGTTSFGRKKKFACRLASSRVVQAGTNATAEKFGTLSCALAFPKINLRNPSTTPRVVVLQKAPPQVVPAAKPERFALNTVRPEKYGQD